MTPEQQRLSRLLAEHPECWEWWAGMLTTNGYRIKPAWHESAPWGAGPDLSDPATAACLAAQAMERGADIWHKRGTWYWRIRIGTEGHADTRGEAAARALLAIGGVLVPAGDDQ